MHKKICALIVVFALVLTAGSSVFAEELDQVAASTNPYDVLTNPDYDLNAVDSALLAAFYATEVSIPDASLKKAIQTAANLSAQSSVTVKDMFSLTGSLNLSGLGIANLTGLEYAIYVTSLTISNNAITSLEPLKNLYNLKYLDYSTNSVKIIPSWIFSLESLESVNGGTNASTVFSGAPTAENTTIKSIYMENNQLTSLPDLSLCSALEILSLSNNKFTQFPSSVLALDGLQMLNIANNEIESVPDLSPMKSLTTINLDGNKITELPVGIENLNALQQFSICNNQIAEIPDRIADSVNLQILLISMNNITTLPESLTKNTTLKVLDISLNNIVISDNTAVINSLVKSLSTFYYKIQKPNFTLKLYTDKEAPAGKLVWSGIEDISDKVEGTFTITGFTIERMENLTGTSSSSSTISVYVPIAEVGANVREYIDKTADAAKSYTYRVTAKVTCLYLNETEYTLEGSAEVSTDDIIKSEASWIKSAWFYAAVAGFVIVIAALAMFIMLKSKKKKRK